MKNPKFLDPIMNILRGESRSIRYTWWVLPREWLKVQWYRLSGKGWITFYAERMNVAAKDVMNTPPPQSYIDTAKLHLDCLIRNGLKPHHSFLDFGCGILRTAKYAIPFLEYGKYVGIEIAEERVKKGRPILRSAGIPDDRYEIIITKDNLLKELEGRQFDVVWAASVFTHMPEHDIKIFLRSLKSHLAPEGVFLFTFSPLGSSVERKKIKDWFHPVSWMKKICEESGYDFSEANMTKEEELEFRAMAKLTLKKSI